MSDEDFRAFVTARSPSLLRTAYLLTGDRGLAEDLLQDALTKAYRHWGRIRDRGSCEAYVRKIVLNERRSRWHRRSSTEVVGAVPDRPASDAVSAYAERDALWRALAEMPPRMRAVLVLRYWEDLSEADTAELLDCSAGTVKSQASRGLARLRELLTEPDTTIPTPEGAR